MKKIVKILVIILVAMFLLLIVWFAWARMINSKELNSNEVIYNSNNNNISKKAIIIYQKSNTSVSDDVAKTLAETLSDNNYDVLVNYPGAFLPKDLSEYNLIIFGSPIYMASTSSTLNNYIEQVKVGENAKVLYYTVGMLDSTEEFASIDELFSTIKLDGKFKIVQGKFKKDKNEAKEKLEKYIEQE